VGLLQGPEQAAEKVKSSEKNCEIHPSAAKAGVNPIDLSARVNSCPFKTALGTSFSAACEGPCSLRRGALGISAGLGNCFSTSGFSVSLLRVLYSCSHEDLASHAAVSCLDRLAGR
jgi:hypothetical protein